MSVSIFREIIPHCGDDNSTKKYPAEVKTELWGFITFHETTKIHGIIENDYEDFMWDLVPNSFGAPPECSCSKRLFFKCLPSYLKELPIIIHDTNNSSYFFAALSISIALAPIRSVNLQASK